MLGPDVEVRADAAAVPAGAPRRVQCAAAVAEQARLALVNGAPGIVVASYGRPVTAIAAAGGVVDFRT